KLPDTLSGLSPRSVERAAIVGAGTMGGGIAMALANAGIPAVIIDENARALARGLSRITKNYAFSVSRGRLEQVQMDIRMSRIVGGENLDAISGADIVIEAVFEDMDLKKSLFAKIGQIARPGAILATNRSGLDIDEIAAVTGRPSDVAG